MEGLRTKGAFHGPSQAKRPLKKTPSVWMAQDRASSVRFRASSSKPSHGGRPQRNKAWKNGTIHDMYGGRMVLRAPDHEQKLPLFPLGGLAWDRLIQVRQV